MASFVPEKTKKLPHTAVVEIPSGLSTPVTEPTGFGLDLEKTGGLAANLKTVVIEEVPSPSDGANTPSPIVPTDAKDGNRGHGSWESAEETFPEGGFEAWSVCFGCWVGFFGSLGLLNSLSAFNAYLLTHQLHDYSASTVGWIWSLYTFFSMVPGLWVGPVFDTYGPQPLLLTGTGLLVAGLMATSFATEYWHFLVSFGGLAGLASAIFLTTCMMAPNHWFKKRRALAMGFVGTGPVIGGILLPVFLQTLLPKIGWAWTLRALAGFVFVTSTICTVMVKTRLPPPRVPASIKPDFTIFRELPFLFMVITELVMELAIYSPINFLSAYALSAGYDESTAFAIVAVLNGAGVAGRFLVCVFVPLLGPLNSAAVAMLFAAATLVGVWLPFGGVPGGLVATAILYGFWSGIAIAAAPLCFSSLCDTKVMGKYYATAYTVIGFAYLVMTPTAGTIVSGLGYAGLLVYSAALFGVALAVQTVLRKMKIGWNFFVKF